MRVAQISTWQTACGIAGYTEALVEALPMAGIDPLIVPIDRTVTTYLTESELRAHFRTLAEKAADAEVIHLQHEFSFLQGPFGAATSIKIFGSLLADVCAAGRPLVVTFHSNPSFLPSLHDSLRGFGRNALLTTLWRTRVAPHFTAGTKVRAVVHTRASRLALVRSGIAPSTITVIPQGVPDIDRTTLAPEEARALKVRLGFAPEAVVLSMFGFVSQYKGYSTAVSALARLPKDHILAIVGGVHPYSRERATEEVLRDVDKRRVRDRVRITGFLPRDAVRDYYRVTAVSLAPYDDVGLSSSAALTWALSARRPVVASRIPAFVELQEAYSCLQLVSPRSARELALAVRTVREDHELRSRLVEGAERYATDNSWARTAIRHADLYKTLLPRTAMETVSRNRGATELVPSASANRNPNGAHPQAKGTQTETGGAHADAPAVATVPRT
jgi:glycosyltransferase involved in cell wall biosynthesis